MRLSSGLSILFLLISGAIAVCAYADCQLPAAPSKIPDGKSASDPEMQTARSTVTEYQADVNTYLKCLEFERRQGHLNEHQETQMHNEAVEALQTVANKFNTQLKVYKSRSG